MRNNHEKSLQVEISQHINRITFSSKENIKIQKVDHKLSDQKSMASYPNDPIFQSSKPRLNLTVSAPKLSNKRLTKLFSLKFVPEQRIEEFKAKISKQPSPKKNKSSQVQAQAKFDIENCNEVSALKNEINRLIKECFKLEETIQKYDIQVTNYKLKIYESAKEIEFLKRKLKESMKDIKISENNKSHDSSSVQTKPNIQKIDTTYNPISSTGKFLLSLTKKSEPGSKKFFELIENFLEYKEFKLQKTLEHYKNTIENFKQKIKSINNDIVHGMSIHDLGSFFSECVEIVRKDVLSLRGSNKLLKNDKKRILEMFVLNENVMKVLYENLINYPKPSFLTQRVEEGLALADKNSEDLPLKMLENEKV